MATKFNKGDHLRVDRGAYDHEGIYVGDGRVVHYSEPWPGAGKGDAVIQETSLAEFARGGQVRIDPSTRAGFPRSEMVRRARSRIGESRYDLLKNNCEHFAAWVRTGESSSDQVQAAMVVGGAVLYGAVHTYGWEKVLRGAVTAYGVVLGLSVVGTLMRPATR